MEHNAYQHVPLEQPKVDQNVLGAIQNANHAHLVMLQDVFNANLITIYSIIHASVLALTVIN